MKIRFFLKKQIRRGFFVGILFVIFIVATLWCAEISPHQNKVCAEQVESVKLPVIMYHLILEKPQNNNQFIISKDIFEQDLKYLKESGYTTILIKDLIDYTQGNAELPKKPILLTFDDGAYNNYLYAFPLAKKYGAKFVFSPIGKEADRYSKINDENPSYAHANWEHIKNMAQSGLVEIQNHTYDMHLAKHPRIGCTQKKSESQEEYRKNLSKDLEKAQKLIKEKTGNEPTAFFYPFGACSKCSEDIVKSLGFKATFLCESKINHITKDSQKLFGLYRILRPPNVPSKMFFRKLEKS